MVKKKKQNKGRYLRKKKKVRKPDNIVLSAEEFQFIFIWIKFLCESFSTSLRRELIGAEIRKYVRGKNDYYYSC